MDKKMEVIYMKQNLTRLLVTKLSQSTHERLKELAKQERRALSAMSRNIIEDYIDDQQSSKK
jgi:predicted DNA-binding protein